MLSEREEVVVTVHIAGHDLPGEDLAVEELRPLSVPARLVSLVAGLALFVTALGLMKTGAAALAPALDGSVFADNPWSALGLGWLGACVTLSGSPVAASALTLLDGGAIDRTSSFMMVTGSRLGAAFVVLVAGVLYAARNGNGARGGRRAPISIGILSLLMTAAVYIPGAAIGFLALDQGAFDGAGIAATPSLTSVTDVAFGWAVDLARGVLPEWTLFPVGVLVLLAGFALFDRVLPAIGEQHLEERGMWQERKWAMFVAGCAVCLLTLSVSVAVTVLVPLVAKGRLHRANALPYIAGANITTLVDTLVAAVLLGNDESVQVVLAIGAGVSLWTVVLLAFAYPMLRRACLGIAREALHSPARLVGFAAMLLVVPVALVAV